MKVVGTYDLHTAAEASLDLFFTATDGNGTSSNQPEQVSTVQRGHGEFKLREIIRCHGWPHVSFYSTKSGTNFGGVYFGYGEWLKSGAKTAEAVSKEDATR